MLQHRFIKTARRTSILTDLIERYQLYRSKSAARGAQSLPTVADLDASLDGTVMSDWSFGTASIAGEGGYGTVRGAGAVVLEEDLESGDDEDDEYGFDGRGLSEVGLQGSTVRGPVRLFISRSPIAHFAHPSITAPCETQARTIKSPSPSLPSLIPSSNDSRTDLEDGPATPPVPGPNFSAIVERKVLQVNQGNGTVLTASDVGSG